MDKFEGIVMKAKQITEIYSKISFQNYKHFNYLC